MKLSAQFYGVIGGVHEVLRMLDGDDGVARFGEAADKVKQVLDVLLMETAGGLVEKE